MKKIVLLDKRLFNKADLERIENFLKVKNPSDFLIALSNFHSNDYSMIKIIEEK